jgi:hypothetical protein
MGPKNEANVKTRVKERVKTSRWRGDHVKVLFSSIPGSSEWKMFYGTSIRNTV